MAVKRGNSRVRATWQPDWGLVRHLLGAGVAGMVLVGLTGAARHISDPENYPLRTVEIPTRLERVDPALLQARLQPVLPQGFFDVQVRDIQRAARSVPWVRQVVVRSEWPDRLVLEIVEHEAAARWNDDRLLNPQGEAFDSGGELPQGLPRLAGPEGSGAQLLARYRELDALLAPAGAIRRLQQDARGTLHIELDQGLELTLGGQQTTAALADFLAVWQRQEPAERERWTHVDLRHVDGFAVRTGTTSSQRG